MIFINDAGRRLRRRLLVIGASSLLLFGSTVHAQAPLKVRLGIVTVSSQMALYVAVAKGMFAKHGFDVQVLPLASGVQANEALAANQVDWSAGGIESTIIAASTSLPFKPYAMYAKGGDSLGILVRKDANIHTARDLIGKHVAVVGGTGSAQGLSDYLKANGLPNDAVKRVNTTFGGMGQMLASGAVQAMVGLEPFLTVTQDRLGDQVVLLTRFGKYVQGGGFFLISDRWAAAHPNQIEQAVEALAEAQQFIREHPRQAAALEAGFIKADAGVVERSSSVFQFTPNIDPFTITSLEKTSQYLTDQKVIDKPVDVSAMLSQAQQVSIELQKDQPSLFEMNTMSDAPSDAPILRADQISKIFRDADGRSVTALSNVSLTVHAGEFVAVVGPSGCGKSTMLRIVAGLESHSGGTIKVIDREVSGPGADRGMVFQEYALLPWKNTLDNVAFGLQLKGMPKDERRKAAQRYIDLVGLRGFEARYPHQLSGGMRQRAAVARALANHPAVLLMDEPFAAIDALTRQRLQEEIAEICRAERMTVLFVTHSVDEAIFLADRVIVLSGHPGHVIADLDIDLVRPRRWEALRNSERFSQIQGALLAKLGHPDASSRASEHL